MTAGDRPGFAALMLGLGETYSEPVSDVRMEIYFAALEDLELATVRRAATLLVRTLKFFPRPAELRDAIVGPQDDRAELAWMSVQRLVQRFGYYAEPAAEDWPDRATQRAALELYGGWQRLCASLPADGPELLGYRKTFLATYRAYDTRDQRVALSGDDRRELTAVEATRALASVVAHRRTLMSAAPTQHDVDKQIAARMVAQEIAASIARCEALERALALASEEGAATKRYEPPAEMPDDIADVDPAIEDQPS